MWQAAPALAQSVPAQRATSAAENSRETLPEVNVVADGLRQEAGTRTVITREEIERTGATGMGDVIRYQPLVEAPGTVTGSTRGASRYDRSGTTGYNIRGIEGNRIGLDIDGIEMPDAISRAPLTNRAQDGTFGMGRDFIDPDIYSAVDIQSGTTHSQRTAGGIGGAVSFRSKSPEDYVSESKPSYFGGKLGYSEVNSAWTQAVTAAGLSGDYAGILSYVRRDGHETKNNSDIVDSYPEDWHSDALLLKGSVRLNAQNKLEIGADLYRKRNDSSFEAWNTAATAVTGTSAQNAQTERNTFHLSHTWTPGVGGIVDVLNTRVYLQETDMDDVTDTLTFATRTAPHSTARDVSQNSTRQVGFSSVGEKRLDNHLLKFGVNYSQTKNEHPFFSSSDASTRQPFPDTTTDRAGVFIEDTIDFQVGGKRLAVVPGLRVDRVKPSIRNAESFGNSRITAAQLEAMYGSTSGTTIASPSLAVLYDIQPTLTAYAQWKRSGRAPTNSEVFGYWNGGGGNYALVGNKDLDKETSDSFDMGLKGSPMPGVVFNSSVFYTRYKDFISYTRYTRANNPELFTNIQPNLNILYQASNRDEATIYGTELSARLDHGTWSPAVKGLYSTWALGYSKGTSKSDFVGDKKVDLDSVQPAKAIFGVGYDAPEKAWGLNLTGVFVKSKQAVATNRQAFSNDPGAMLADATVEQFRVPGFARFDLSAYWRVTQNVRLAGGIYNLADKQYWAYSHARSLQPALAQDRRQIELSTAPGRSFAVSLNVDF
ncbi:TonB-dependent receptor domain-containing protein [Variovorax guangxiensis]|nr:TonB-dependent receptor [Variovorax guangxiensis]